jgi:hypothetical protein
LYHISPKKAIAAKEKPIISPRLGAEQEKRGNTPKITHKKAL